MRNGRGKAFWEKLVREVANGATQTSVAQRHGVSPTWLGKWCRQLRDERALTTLLPVRTVDQPTRRVELAIGGARLWFDCGTDPAYIAAIARALAS